MTRVVWSTASPGMTCTVSEEVGWEPTKRVKGLAYTVGGTAWAVDSHGALLPCRHGASSRRSGRNPWNVEPSG